MTEQNKQDDKITHFSDINYRHYDHRARQLRSTFFWNLFSRWTSKRESAEAQTVEADVCLCH